MKNYRFVPGTAIVTGAASGIGAAIAHGLASRGSRLPGSPSATRQAVRGLNGLATSP